MEIELEPGIYVVAVSGGVDSIALLDVLARRGGYRLVVAHLDHGIREESQLDRQLVQAAAEGYGLPFVFDQARLGPGASEEAARKVRYGFLHKTRQASGARAVITAHHQDDLLETAVLNLLRGTGRRGLAALRSRETLERPLLDVPKAQLIAYAQKHRLHWHEDSTNRDEHYLRNYIRHQILPRFSEEQKQKLLGHIKSIRARHDELESLLARYLQLHPAPNRLDRHWFIMLPHAVAREVLAAWLRRYAVHNLTSRLLERLVIAAKTGAPGSQIDVDKKHVLSIAKDSLALRGRER